MKIEITPTAQKQELAAFNYNGVNLDYGLLNGEPLFHLKTIAKYLELTNHRMAIDTSDPDYCRKVTNSAVNFTYIRKLNNAGELFLTEAGLYRLLMRSNKAEAEAFQKWVTKEVLPSIRKHGGYIAQQEEMSSEQLLAKALKVADSIIQNKDKLIVKQKETIDDQAEIISAYKIADKTKREKQELATLLNRKVRELAEIKHGREYNKAYNEIYTEFRKLHCINHKIDMQFLRTNLDYLSECVKIVLDKIDEVKNFSNSREENYEWLFQA